MMLIIKTETITFTLENLLTTDSLSSLYDKVAQRTEYKTYQFELTYYGEPLPKGSNTLEKSGLEEECTVVMNLLKELEFIVLFGGNECKLTIPNNDGLTIQHLIVLIKKNLSDSILEINESDFYIKKGGVALARNALLHAHLGNMDIIEIVLGNLQSQEQVNTLDDDLLIQSFLQTSISSDVEIVFCFDTTGSMSSIIGKVREQVEQTVSRLMKDIPNIRIGIVGLGDYCDKEKVLTTLDLTRDVDKLVKFIKEVPSTSGGDAPEAYEWALRKAKSLSWSKHTSKAFVMIGDCEPHEPSHTDLKINWFEECDDLFDLGVKIYGVKALGNCVFYEEIAERTGGICINFNKFSLITEMFLAICYREASKEKFNKFEKEINSNNNVSAEMTEILSDLKKENFKVVESTNASTTTTTTTSTSNSNNITIKQRGLPIKMRSLEKWFKHSEDTATKPTFTYNKEKDCFFNSIKN
ncbi:hypothetical protein PPL_01540 [Heterostelium album PN500]|uniref:VWFA domain-containing protein n=1 Tax=Heterostelium pallidum (strain ATCC 26659 / Pp 5 / PN500) TaxID=670386 RepID=D3AZS7_HETP5|nr:hypothetical protein PPL_01540 [Heterostelium album PN500]EFA84551.1 hypothetical protein PPL_01540 [Heterostelium album PN500]|eukprot:XP_020436664.1 hypothetical protein PPL_01540 [Heterostelium album PN500]